MRDWFLYHFVSGQACWSGFGLLLVAWLLSWQSRSRFVARSRSWCLVLGITAIVLSATPLPIVLALVCCVLLGVWLWCDRSPVSETSASSLKIARLRWLILLSWCVCVAFEWPHHISPRFNREAAREWAVIGDSLSAEFGEGTPWPAHLARHERLSIHNLAVAGATARSAMQQLEELKAGCFVLVEIGGNDLLGSTSASQFESDLDQLLSALKNRKHDIVMFELPLPPWGYQYGVAQRRLARRHEFALIPKRILADVLTTPGATNDGLHLSQLGHAKLASHVSALRR